MYVGPTISPEQSVRQCLLREIEYLENMKDMNGQNDFYIDVLKDALVKIINRWGKVDAKPINSNIIPSNIPRGNSNNFNDNKGSVS